MLLNGLISIQDLSIPGQTQIRPLRSSLLSKQVNGVYFLTIKNSMYPNCINYKVADLEAVHTKFVKDGKATLRFKQPKHQILLNADDRNILFMFLRQIQDIISGKDVKIGTRQIPKKIPSKKDVNRFDPSAHEFIAADRFDKRILNMRHLHSLILENCVLPSLPEHIGDLPISLFSLTGSKLATASQYDQDIYWNWMSKTTISHTLTSLKMDSVNLKILPFEIMFLKKLQDLSLAKNKLINLPQCIGELKKLHTLSISDNLLRFMPDNLINKQFKSLDVSNNHFINEQRDAEIINNFNSKVYEYDKNKQINKVERIKTVNTNCINLVLLTIRSIINNSIRFYRQEIPRTLWRYFDAAGRCRKCEQFVLPQEYFEFIHFKNPQAVDYQWSNYITVVPWLSFECYKCIELSCL